MENNQKVLHDFVNLKIASLAYRDESYIRAILAKLRRGVGKHPGNIPDIWDYTLEGLPEKFLSSSEYPTPWMWSVHISLTLFALHQQGKDLKMSLMSKSGGSLGSAVGILAKRRGAETENAVKRRFDAVITSNSAEELAHHLRGLIYLLKSVDLPLDYPRLAEDLYKFQFPERRDGVRLKWGQDYYYDKGKDDKNDQE